MGIKKETVELLRNYLLNSILPSREVQELVRLLDEVEEVKKDGK